jgi:hypothetical protein
MAVAEKSAEELYYSIRSLHNDEMGPSRVKRIVKMEIFGRAYTRQEIISMMA